MIYVTLYNPAIDLQYEVDDLRNGNTFTSLESSSFPAGKGLNVAKVIKKLGEPVTLISIMPTNDLNRFKSYLDKLGIAHAFFKVDGNVRVNTTIAEKSSGITQHFNSKSEPLTQSTGQEFEKFISKRIESKDTWILSGSIPSSILAKSYSNIIDICNKRGAEVAVDTRDKALSYAIRSKPLIITPNEDELEACFEEPIKGVQHLAFKGKRLIDMGIPYVFITLGSDGAIALHKNECIICKIDLPDKVIDTVGCGDAFLGGIIVGKERGFSFHEMCRLAIACGASNAVNRGPGEIDRDQVWRYMEKVNIKSI